MSTEEVPIPELLKRLNALRQDLDRPSLKTWKASRQKIVDAIQEAKAEAQQRLDAKVNAADTQSEQQPEKKTQTKSSDKTFTLSELCKELDINPKIARAKARRRADKLEAYRVGDEGWTFDAKHREAVTKLFR